MVVELVSTFAGEKGPGVFDKVLKANGCSRSNSSTVLKFSIFFKPVDCFMSAPPARTHSPTMQVFELHLRVVKMIC